MSINKQYVIQPRQLRKLEFDFIPHSLFPIPSNSFIKTKVFKRDAVHLTLRVPDLNHRLTTYLNFGDKLGEFLQKMSDRTNIRSAKEGARRK